jgi:hypothetical protein
MRTFFFHESALRSFSLATFWQKKLFRTKKRARKMLMKLTLAVRGKFQNQYGSSCNC